jgi:hypothetical protein
MSSQYGEENEGTRPSRAGPWKPEPNFPYGKNYAHKLPYHPPNFEKFKAAKAAREREEGGDKRRPDPSQQKRERASRHRQENRRDDGVFPGGQEQRRGRTRNNRDDKPSERALAFGQRASEIFSRKFEEFMRSYRAAFQQIQDKPRDDEADSSNYGAVWSFGVFGNTVMQELITLFLQVAGVRETQLGRALEASLTEYLRRYTFNPVIAPVPPPPEEPGQDEGGAEPAGDDDNQYQGPARQFRQNGDDFEEISESEDGGDNAQPGSGNVFQGARRRAGDAARRGVNAFRDAARRVMPSRRSGPSSAPPPDDLDRAMRNPSPAIEAAARRRLESMGYKTRRPPPSGSPVTV